MRISLRPALLVLPLLLAAPPLHAQVTTDDKALDQLKPATPPATPGSATGPSDTLITEPTAPKPPVAHHTTHRPAAGHTGAKTTAAKPAAKAAALPAVPLAPPANPVILPPPVTMPAHPAPPPPPVPVVATAAGTVTAIDHGERLTFGPNSADLNQTTYDSLVEAATRAKLDRALEITITAWAPGTQDDPSTPRRLSLDRALAGRAVLIFQGIESDRIHAVAKGFIDIGTGSPPDRMDVILAAPRATPAGKPAPVPATAPASTTPGSNPK